MLHPGVYPMIELGKRGAAGVVCALQLPSRALGVNCPVQQESWEFKAVQALNVLLLLLHLLPLLFCYNLFRLIKTLQLQLLLLRCWYAVRQRLPYAGT